MRRISAAAAAAPNSIVIGGAGTGVPPVLDPCQPLDEPDEELLEDELDELDDPVEVVMLPELDPLVDTPEEP